jgi:hypothetical protein
MRRKLSNIEHVLDGNVLCRISLESSLSAGQLRSALSRVQRRHPALRALIREESDGLYYEEDCAPEIPLHIVAVASEDDQRRECERELTTPFAYNQPQLRATWLQSEQTRDLLLTTSHRICDGKSIFILVKEILQSLYSEGELVPYAPITTHDIIGSYRPAQTWKLKLKMRIFNGVLRLIPSPRLQPEKMEYSAEWKANPSLLPALKERCKVEGVSVHAALIVALEHALFAVFGKRLPKHIDNQIDPRRGNFPTLKNDALFFGGGSFKVRTGQAPGSEFWAAARAIYKDMSGEIEQELLNIPRRFHFIEALRPLTDGQVQSIMRLTESLQFRRRSSFALSNIGNIVIDDSGAPFRLKDLRLYVHSFKTRALGLVTYTVNGEMYFYCVSHNKCLTPDQVNTLKHEFMTELQHQAMPAEDGPARVSPVAVANGSHAFDRFSVSRLD